MKILHLTNHLNTGGITTYIRTLTGEQVRAGHRVFVWGASGSVSAEFKAMGVSGQLQAGLPAELVEGSKIPIPRCV